MFKSSSKVKIQIESLAGVQSNLGSDLRNTLTSARKMDSLVSDLLTLNRVNRSATRMLEVNAKKENIREVSYQFTFYFSSSGAAQQDFVLFFFSFFHHVKLWPVIKSRLTSDKKQCRRSWGRKSTGSQFTCISESVRYFTRLY